MPEQCALHSGGMAVHLRRCRDQRARWTGHGIVTWPELAFVALFGVYLGRFVDMHLVFWNQHDMLLWNFAFMREFLAAPGGPSCWLGKLVLQPCRFGWPGAFGVAAMAGAALALARVVFSSFAPAGTVQVTTILTAAVLVILHSQYWYSSATTIAVILVLFGTCIHIWAGQLATWSRWTFFVVVSTLLYWLVGEAFWAFVGCCAIYDLLRAGRTVSALMLLPTAVAVKLGVDAGLSHVSSPGQYDQLLTASYLIQSEWSGWYRAVLLAYFPTCALVLAAVSRHREAAQSGQQQVPSSPPTDCRPVPSAGEDLADDVVPGGASAVIEQQGQSCGVRWWPTSPRRLAAWLLMSAVFAALTLFSSRTTRKLLKIDYASAHHDWETVLSSAHGLSPSVYPDYANQDVNLALHHLGRLPEDMFRYPQRRLFCEHGFGSRGRLFSRKAFDLFLQLGRVNDAEVIAHNDFEGHPSAAFLLRIARVKLIKREIGAARLYLNVLRDDSCYGRWADSCLQRLAEGRELGEPEMEEVRSRMLTEDDVGRTHVRLPDGTWSVSAEEALASLLNRNPRNRMAFEYLMALHLLNRDHASVVRALSRLKAFAYRQTPQLYEEAALLHAGNQSRKPRMTSTGIEIDGIAIRRSTLNRFLRLYALERTYRGFDNPDAQDALLREFGHSYFAYAFGAGAREHE